MTALSKTAQHILMKLFYILVLPLVLSACSGGETGTGAIESDSSIIIGRISDIDNDDDDRLYINDIEFDTDDSSFSVDNEDASKDDLKKGMIVEVEAVISEDGQTGEAIHIRYIDILEAFVDKNQLDEDGTGILIIAGQTVNIDSLTVFDSQVESIDNISDIENKNIIEVSGFTSGNGYINATRIDVKAQEFVEGEEIEVKGRVAALNADTFRIGALIVNFSNASLINLPDEGLRNGQYIEAMSTTGLNDANELIATTLTLLVNAPGQGNVPAAGASNGDTPVHIEGLVTSVITTGEEFTLNGQTVIITETTVIAAGATAEDIIENQTVTVVGFIDTEGIITATMIRFG